ncbi:hypothetical protein ACFWCB_16680 [Streptomyces sp. NPDC060048]|uniref:hypothetical protein n=1 Tax=unclassified Streptomyces TaxID=2593676 RepID=UPI0036A3680F
MKPTTQSRPGTGPRSRTRLRFLPAATAAALALATGLLSAPAASAATADPATPKVSAPRTGPTPGFYSEDRYSACDTDLSGSGPGWVGNNDLTFTVTGRSPAGKPLTPTFQLWDTTYGGKRTDYPGGAFALSDYQAYIGKDKLTDGKQYGWRARVTDSKLTSAYTPWCYFRVDQTQPTAGITSTDFPSSDSGITPTKFPGEEGTLTLTGADTGSGVACARWGTSGTPSVGWKCSDEATDSHIVRLTDGSADIKFRPPTWGSTNLYVEMMDDAGNISQPVRYSFYVPSDPKARGVFGDIDHDRKPDVLLPDAVGNLRKPGADPNGPANARNVSAPGGTNTWATIQYTHRGGFGPRIVDDLFAHAPGGSYAYVFRNNEGGDFASQGAMALSKPTTCLDPAAGAISCADHGFGTDWTQVTAIAAVGSPTGDTNLESGALPATSLLFVEHGRLWLAGRGMAGNISDSATLISPNDTRWAGYDLLTPGRAQGTDIPTLWARSKADGTIRAFSLGSPAAFANPAAGPVLATLTTQTAPRVGSDGDLTGDGLPDLWSVSATGVFTIHAAKGTATPYPTVTGFAVPTP